MRMYVVEGTTDELIDFHKKLESNGERAVFTAIIDQEEKNSLYADVHAIRTIFEMRAREYSYEEIITHLENESIEPPKGSKRWNPGHLTSILKNADYVGLGIVYADLFDKANEIKRVRR